MSAALPVRQQSPDLLCILRVDKRFTPQVALLLGSLAGQDVAVIGLFSLDLPTLKNGEPLGRATARLQFGHFQISLSRNV